MVRALLLVLVAAWFADADAQTRRRAPAQPPPKTEPAVVECPSVLGDGVKTGRHAATLVAGSPGVLHGAMSYLLQDDAGQIKETHSISAGLDYPGVGPEHAFFKDSGRAEYVAADDRTALDGFQLLARTEGILGALEPSHAIGYLKQLAPTLPSGTTVLVGLSGRGDKDVHVIARALGERL